MTVFPSIVQGIIMTTRKRMCDIKGISEAKMEKIKEAASKLEVMSNFDYYKLSVKIHYHYH